MEKEHIILFKETYDNNQKELEESKKQSNESAKLLYDILKRGK